MSFGLAFLLVLVGMLLCIVHIGLSTWIADVVWENFGEIGAIVSIIITVALPFMVGIAWAISNGS